MDTYFLLQIAQIVALISVSILVFFLIFYLISLNKLIKSLLKDISDLSNQILVSLTKVTDEIQLIRNRLESTLTNSDSTLDQIRVTFQNVDEKVNKIGNMLQPFEELANYIYLKVSTPLISTAKVISGAYKAVNSFVDVLSKKRKEDGTSSTSRNS